MSAEAVNPPRCVSPFHRRGSLTGSSDQRLQGIVVSVGRRWLRIWCAAGALVVMGGPGTAAASGGLPLAGWAGLVDSNAATQDAARLPVLQPAERSTPEDAALRPAAALLRQATVRILQPHDRCSGVLLTASGLVLTVAHGLPSRLASEADAAEPATVTVLLSTGAQRPARVVYRDAVADIGLLQLETQAEDQLTPLIWNEGVVVRRNDVLLSAGYPGREQPGSSPVLRIGRAVAVDTRVLRSSCALTVGDSGGPVINLRGELVGIHQRIGLAADSNHHLPMTLLVPVLRDRLRGQVVRRLSDLSAAESTGLLECTPVVRAALRRRSVQIAALAAAQPDGSPAAVADPPIEAMGTLLGGRLVATKLSELRGQIQLWCRTSVGSGCAAELWKQDRQLDLAVLRLSEPLLPDLPEPTAADLQTPESRPVPDGLPTQLLVFAATATQPESCRCGIVTRDRHSEPAWPVRLGAVLHANPQHQLQVQEVAPNSTAATAQLTVNDWLTHIDDVPVTSLDQLSWLLQERQPGDWLQLGVLRGDQQLLLSGQLQADPAEQFEKSEFLDGRAGRLSARRSGLQGVLQCDVPLQPEECGGPLVDSGGRLLGISLARRAREATLAVPLQQVLRLATSE